MKKIATVIVVALVAACAWFIPAQAPYQASGSTVDFKAIERDLMYFYEDSLDGEKEIAQIESNLKKVGMKLSEIAPAEFVQAGLKLAHLRKANDYLSKAKQYPTDEVDFICLAADEVYLAGQTEEGFRLEELARKKSKQTVL